MPPSFEDLVADLEAETAALRGLLAPLAYGDWSRPTPADGWTIADQMSHLMFFDEMNTLAAADPEAFRAQLEAVFGDPAGIVDGATLRLRSLTADEIDRRFEASRAAMIEAFRALPPGTRVPWYGPDMSAASSLTARIMETWAHGQDIADTLDAPHIATRALRNVAHICARTMPNSFRTRGLDIPDVDVRVELDGGDEMPWAWGSDAHDSIRGNAVEFCLVCTQRRHIDDTTLRVAGSTARKWMEIAQAFAGPPGTGRAAINQQC